MNQQPQRLDIAFTIAWQADWHVGSGRGTSHVDRLLRRRACGPRGERLPFVPGSQIKGVLRHQCERLLAVLGGEVVSPHVVGAAEADPRLLEQFRPLACSRLLIDRLFGSRYQGECLFVEDAVPQQEGMRFDSRIHSRTSIDRVTGTARERTLFVTEVASGKNTRLHSRLQARHAPGTLTQDGSDFPFEYSLLIAGLLSLDQLGGDKSIGLGRCHISIVGDVVRWNDRTDYPLPEALKSFEEQEWLELLQLCRQDGGV
jgi:CRISPR/Cas system CSM-associated protein Csm3 (group 7 of RAMP superfamily)